MIYLALTFNLVAFIFYRKAHIDYDSASHIYKAINYKEYKTGYKIGIKLPLVFLYKNIYTYLSQNKYFFRYSNFFIINSLTFIFFIKSDRNLQNNLIIFALVILLNSFWINPSTSSSEIYEILILVIMIFFSKEILSSLDYKLLLITIGSILLISFKFLNSIYLISLFFLISDDLNNILKNITFLLLIGVTVLIAYNSRNSLTYAKSRTGFIHVKSKIFLKNNFYFILNLFLFIIYTAKISEGFEILFIITSVILIFIQKQFFSYFLLHISCLGLYFILDKNISEIDKIVLIVIFSNLILLSLINLFRFYKIQNYYKLVRILIGESVSDYLSDQKKQVEWLKSVDSNLSIYFIGVDTPLLVNAKLNKLDNTFYNENHLTYWSSEASPKSFIMNEITSMQSDLILVSKPMSVYTDTDFSNLNYEKINEIGSLRVFKKLI